MDQETKIVIQELRKIYKEKYPTKKVPKQLPIEFVVKLVAGSVDSNYRRLYQDTKKMVMESIQEVLENWILHQTGRDNKTKN